MLEHKENKELTEAEVNAYDLVIICYGKLRKDCLWSCIPCTLFNRNACDNLVLYGTR